MHQNYSPAPSPRLTQKKGGLIVFGVYPVGVANGVVSYLL